MSYSANIFLESKYLQNLPDCGWARWTTMKSHFDSRSGADTPSSKPVVVLPQIGNTLAS